MQEMQILSYPSNPSSDVGDLFVNTSWKKVLSPAHVSLTFSALDRWWGCNPYRACSHPTTRVIDAKGLNMDQKVLKMLVLNIKHLTFRLKNLQIRGKKFWRGVVDQFCKIVCDKHSDREGRKRDWGIKTPPPHRHRAFKISHSSPSSMWEAVGRRPLHGLLSDKVTRWSSRPVPSPETWAPANQSLRQMPSQACCTQYGGLGSWYIHR